MKKYLSLGMALAGLAVLNMAAINTANAQAMRTNAGFNSHVLGANDDGSTGSVSIGFMINLFGNNYNNLYVNNNGNVTFDFAMSTFTPFPLLSTSTRLLAPFFGDVDTRPGGSANVMYGTSTVDGHAAFGVNWDGVGYYYYGDDKLNRFQLVMIDRSDIAPGDFDFEFNYNQIQWETGDASGGNAGLGGASARAGWSDGATNSYEIAGAAINGAYLDSNGAMGLIHNHLNSSVDGRYLFSVRNGSVAPPTSDVPEPGSVALLTGLSISGLAIVRRRRNRK
jgi:hypothetical protein